MFKVTFSGKQNVTAELEQELSLLHAARRAGVELTHRCGGHARCGTCRVTVEDGADHLSEKGGAETRILGILKASPEERLACQAWAQGDAVVKIG